MEDNETIIFHYRRNKRASVGEDMECPICGKVFKKKQYSQAFCCTQCKDDFWNDLRRKKAPAEVRYTSNFEPKYLSNVIELID